jgi:glucosylglycerol-phosphate synthase
MTQAAIRPSGNPAGLMRNPAPAGRARWTLATDLDGTFLAGDADARLALYQTLTRDPGAMLIYVTGRGLETVLPLLSDPTLPRPDYIVCDVGATVVHGDDLRPVQPLQARIESQWPGEEVIAAALDDWPGLARQDVPQERRCSYYCAPEAVTDGLKERISDLGCELHYSADRYLDILPPGTSKGTTLLELVEHLRLDPDRLLVAGDSLNDLSMFRAGFRGVCVGESEPGLLCATADSERVLHTNGSGCEGIIEGLQHFRLANAHANTASGEPGHADLVVVYHRLPYEEVTENDIVIRRRPSSPNGILPTLLSFFADGRRGSWVAWTVHESGHGRFEPHTAVDTEAYTGLTAARVPLTKPEVDIFYRRFSKEAFWPLLHTFWERARFRDDHWQVYRRVNRLFAERTAAEAAHGAPLWIHDYNLWLVPAYLRELRPDLRIAFFHHTYFPSADVFNVVPWRREIVASLMQCDYIGFHIPRQVENFVDVVRGVMPVDILARERCAPRFLTYGCAVGLDRVTTALETEERVVRLGAHPVGVDIDRVRRALRATGTAEERRALRAATENRKLIFSIERLDYTKGTLEKLQAFERLLDSDPELHDRVTLICVCVPAASEMTIYRQLQTQIEQAVGRINGRHSRVGWTPVRFFFRSLSFDQVVAWYAESDVMWVTPLRDGLNLVAKEYVATQGLLRGAGVLVLSEFAGVAAELKGALLTNPHDPSDLVSVLRQALNMNKTEARARLRGLFGIVRHRDARRWGRDFLEAVHAACDYRNANTSKAVAATSNGAPTRSEIGSARTGTRSTEES